MYFVHFMAVLQNKQTMESICPLVLLPVFPKMSRLCLPMWYPQKLQGRKCEAYATGLRQSAMGLLLREAIGVHMKMVTTAGAEIRGR